MEHLGTTGDDRTYPLPHDWAVAEPAVLQTATQQALASLSGDEAFAGVTAYYDRSGSYAGTLFLDAAPNDPSSIDAADLYAVTTLSMKLDARHGRLLLEEGAARQEVRRHLAEVDAKTTLLDVVEADDADLLTRMWDLYDHLRTLLPGDSNRWVTAAKICARKRPRLFPVRDNRVCEYLGGGGSLRSGDGRPGDFSIDIQVYVYLMTHPEVRSALTGLRERVTANGRMRVDEADLRLLDVALWMAAGRTTAR